MLDSLTSSKCFIFLCGKLRQGGEHETLLNNWARYKRNEQHYRVALFFSAASLAGAFGGILAYGIAHMKGVGGYNGWRWIFILEGILTVLVSMAAYAFIANYPATAGFLSEQERSQVQHRLKGDNDATRDEAFAWRNVSRAIKDPKCWLYGLGFHTMSLPLYTLSLFLVSREIVSADASAGWHLRNIQKSG